ncbi:MAG: HEAT repeat domain-containing protein [Elusimicrobiota bacterium]
MVRTILLGTGLLLAPVPARARMGNSDLIKELERSSAAEKPLLVRALGRGGGKRATAPLLKLFDIRGGSPELSSAVVDALGRVGSREAAPALLDAWEYLMEMRFRMASLPAHLQTLRARIAEALGRLGDPKALPALRRGLIDEDGLVAERSLEALSRMRDVQSMDMILRHLGGPDPGLRQAACEALGEFKGLEKARSALRESLASGSPATQAAAAYGLARHGEEIGLLKLEGFLEEVSDPYPEGMLAAYYLVRLGKKQGLEYLLRIMEDEKSPLRFGALQALGKAGEAKAAAPLAKRLEEGKDPAALRLPLVMALGRLGGTKAVYALKKAALDADAAVRGAARLALADLGEYERP